MKTQKISRINQFSAWFFCLAILTQNGVEAPVLCFETDGHINLEAGCDISCKIPAPKNDEHQDDCEDCIDIHLWNYNPNLTFIYQSHDHNSVKFDITQIFISQESIPEITSNFRSLKNKELQLTPLLKNTILLI